MISQLVVVELKEIVIVVIIQLHVLILILLSNKTVLAFLQLSWVQMVNVTVLKIKSITIVNVLSVHSLEFLTTVQEYVNIIVVKMHIIQNVRDNVYVNKVSEWVKMVNVRNVKMNTILRMDIVFHVQMVKYMTKMIRNVYVLKVS